MKLVWYLDNIYVPRKVKTLNNQLLILLQLTDPRARGSFLRSELSHCNFYSRFTPEEVGQKVESYRTMLIGSDVQPGVARDEFGRVK